MVFFLAKNEKDRQMSRFPGRDICGAVKNPRFLNSPYIILKAARFLFYVLILFSPQFVNAKSHFPRCYVLVFHIFPKSCKCFLFQLRSFQIINVNFVNHIFRFFFLNKKHQHIHGQIYHAVSLFNIAVVENVSERDLVIFICHNV